MAAASPQWDHCPCRLLARRRTVQPAAEWVRLLGYSGHWPSDFGKCSVMARSRREGGVEFLPAAGRYPLLNGHVRCVELNGSVMGGAGEETAS